MRITLIGMSGVGKSYWSNKIATDLGYAKIDCDERINAKLSEKLANFGVTSDFLSISQWRGLPFESGYQEKEALQIAIEQEIMKEVTDELTNTSQENLVIDASGSVIYALGDTLSQLKKETTCVYIEATRDHIHSLYTDEIIFKRPLIWGKEFYCKNGETGLEAMKRSYADVLSWRSAQYEKLADKVIPFEHARRANSALELFDL